MATSTEHRRVEERLVEATETLFAAIKALSAANDRLERVAEQFGAEAPSPRPHLQLVEGDDDA